MILWIGRARLAGRALFVSLQEPQESIPFSRTVLSGIKIPNGILPL
jgi:hypothetical protein